MAHELGAKIEAALENSEALIVVCSRRSARSNWVEKEVTFFKALGRETRVFALIVDGVPHDSAQECFPNALKHRVDSDRRLTDVPAEPLAVDVRRDRPG